MTKLGFKAADAPVVTRGGWTVVSSEESRFGGGAVKNKDGEEQVVESLEDSIR